MSEDCYRALGVVHTTWPAVPGRFKDYISTPKQNDYRSIHTTVVGPGQQRVELQIRTEEMDQVAEYGIAAHASTRRASAAPAERQRPGIDQNQESAPISLAAPHHRASWPRATTPEEFLEHTKLELFQDQVFCFTPKGG
jgi:guanosine-3',5'-bis(diphosphate) 3'-pyrophosphohydrolase